MIQSVNQYGANPYRLYMGVFNTDNNATSGAYIQSSAGGAGNTGDYASGPLYLNSKGGDVIIGKPSTESKTIITFNNILKFATEDIPGQGYYNINPSTNGHFYIINTGTSIGNAGVVLQRGQTTWSPYTSDERTKKNIKPYTETILDKINKITVSNFSYLDDITNKQHLGFIAQDLKKALPNIVRPSGIKPEDYNLTEDDVKDDPLLTVNTTDGMVPYLVKAIQEQYAHFVEQNLNQNLLLVELSQQVKDLQQQILNLQK